jgi:hypothetical protein
MTPGAAMCPWRRLVASALTVIAVVATPLAQEPPPGRSLAFDGSWSASGQRQTIPTESGQPAAIARVSGAVVLSNGSGIAAGFAAEAIAFDDGTSATTGRAVWTDGAGDRIFSTLRGGQLQAKRRIVGAITGGTGRWTGVTGEYELTWQYVVSADGGEIQGRSVDLRGQLRWPELRR